jgi:hypothetical protein
MVLGTITALAAVVWLLGWRYLLASARPGQKQEEPPLAVQDAFEGLSRHSLIGSVEVEGQARALLTKAASLLATDTLFPLGPVKIMHQAADDIRFESLGTGWVREGHLHFTPAGQDRTCVCWAVELAPRSWLLWLGGAFQVAGLIALGTGYWAIDTFLVSSPDPELRWQTLQMLQVVHLLWPPFLWGALYRQGRCVVAARFAALAHNLPYCQN